MVGRLDGKVAVVTGGCSGIGLGAVELFVAEGASVIAADLQAEKGEMLERRFPDRVRFSRCDVTVEDELAKTMALAESAFGGLDILFNNAGHGGTPAGVQELTVDGWDKTFALLVRGPAIGMKHATPLMLKRGGGSIINTASVGLANLKQFSHHSKVSILLPPSLLGVTWNSLIVKVVWMKV